MKRPLIIVLLTLALVFALAGIAAVMFFTISNTSLDFVNDDFTTTATAEESQSLGVTSPITLKVLNEHGDVTVIGSDVDTVTVDVTKTGFGTTQSQAEASLDSIKYDLTYVNDVVNLTYKFPGAKRQVDQQVDFVITVPKDSKVDVQVSLGAVQVSNIQEDVVLNNQFGNITMDKVDGSLDVNTNSGSIDLTSIKAGAKDIDIYSGFGATTLEQVSGANITIESKSGKIDLENLRATKKLAITTDFGDVKFMTGTAGTLDVSTKSGSISLTAVNVTNELTLRDNFGNITLEQVIAASYDAETDSGAVTIDGVKGKVRAHSGFGNIDITNAEDTTLDLFTKSGTIEFAGSLGEGPHTVHSDFGDISLNLPADTAVNIDIETQFGKITSDLPITVTLTGDITQGQQTGTINGGGADFKVDTQSGNISIKILK